MASNEGLRKTTRAILVNIEPDYCWTPLIPLVDRLVPYTISASFDWSIHVEPTVLFTSQRAFNMSSRIPRVIGDEEGTGGGLFSGVYGGHCRPIEHSSTVRAGKHFVVRHGDLFWMNCNERDVPNTRGRAIFLEIESAEEIVAGNDALAENFPYRSETFLKISSMAPWIARYSERYGVPPAAVAGAIADEFNASGPVDAIQDWFIGTRPEGVLEMHEQVGFGNKALNAMKHDLGPGNIKLETAWAIYQQNRSEFPGGAWGRAEVADYIMTEQGTAHVAALFMRDAQRHFAQELQGLPDAMRDAALVTSYKRGIENYNLAAALQNQPFKPGEGIRTLLQRFELLEALNGDVEGGSLRDEATGKSGVKVTR